MGSRRCCGGGGVLEKTFLQTVVVVLVVAVAVMAESIDFGSSISVCPATRTSFLTLEDSELLFVPAAQRSVTFNVSVERCAIEEHFELDLRAIDEHFKAVFVKDYLLAKWFQLRFKLDSGRMPSELFVIVEASKTYRESRSVWVPCQFPVFNVTSDATTELFKKCNEDGGWKDFYKNILGDDVFDDLDGEETSRNLHELGKGLDDRHNNNFNFNNQVYRPSYRGGHVIFIPVGAILFMLSVCLRCCLCRRKKMVQRVRTITVVRRVSVPNSSGADVNEPTSPDPLDLPPSYAEIEVEPPPPAYSELENVASLVRHQEHPAADGDPSMESSSAADTIFPAEGDLGEVGTRSTLTRVLTAGSRSLKSQFAFQPMKEEEN